MSYSDIPEELRALKQWVLWKNEDIGASKPTKVPYTVQDTPASVSDPRTWNNFDNVVNNCTNGYSGIGFVFTDNDPYTFIDLDDTEGDNVALDRQLKIYKEFDSWSEVSPSGKGLHIIIKGSIPQGRRRSYIEIYSSGRYATFTGKVYNNKPIAERQHILTQLYEQMGSGGIATNVYKGNDKEKQTDEQIIEQASTAANGDKFKSLFSGKWQLLYPSQSEADFALIDIVAFYTQNRDQITRIFRKSNLGVRDKAKRKDYVTWMINKSFDRMLPPIDFDGFKIALQEKLQEHHKQNTKIQTKKLASDIIVRPHTLKIPPGLLGEIAQFIYAAAPRPVPEIALAGAIGLMAGVCGRAYNISGTGLNQYVLLLAQTGTGKEAMASGIDRLMNTIRLQVPTSIGFIGPSEIASGQALIKHLNKVSQCFVSILGEFGLRLEALTNPHSNSAEKALKRMLLDLYHKSGFGQAFRPTIYADRDKNIDVTVSPSFTILAESTPSTFYGALNEDMIADGLLPRFLIVEYEGSRPPLSHTHLEAQPSFTLIERFGSLVANCEMIMFNKRVINVASTKEADDLLKQFDKFADDQINATQKEVLRQLWNRAHMKVLKLSALIAIGVNMSDPIVIPEYVEWSIVMVQNDIQALSGKFDRGEIGKSASESKQFAEVIRMMKHYFEDGFEKAAGYGVEYPLYEAKVIPYVYLSRRLISQSAFKADRMGSTNAIKRTLQTMIESDVIREIGKQELAGRFGTTQRAFYLRKMELIS